MRDRDFQCRRQGVHYRQLYHHLAVLARLLYRYGISVLTATLALSLALYSCSLFFLFFSGADEPWPFHLQLGRFFHSG